MKQKTFVLREQAHYDSLFKFLDENSKDRLLEVTVREHQKDRSVLQNNLLWRWQSIIAETLGWELEEVHFYYKKLVLVRIFERDDIGYAEMINTIRKVYTEGFKQDAEKMHRHIVKLTSTTSATQRQFAEYLKQIERDAASKNIILPRKEDLYYESLMIKRNEKV